MPPNKKDDLERRLQEERDVAEIVTRQLKVQHSAVRVELERLANQRKEELTQAQTHFREQQEAAEGLIQQMAMEREESRSQLSAAEARATSLEQEKKAAEVLVHQLKAERRTQLSGFESHLQNLEEKLALAQRQFQDQREAVTRMIQRRTVGGEENQ